MQRKADKYDIIASLDYYTEGPVVDSEGNIYFTSLSGGVIYKYGIDGRLEEWATSPCPNGQLIVNTGNHLVCDIKTASVRIYDPAGEYIANLVEGICAGIKINCPNDLVSDRAGNIYFSDSVRFSGNVFCVMQDGSEKLIQTGMDYPNGLAISRDGKYLFVAESFKNRIVKIDLASCKPEEWVKLPEHSSGIIEKNLPDGLTADLDGNIWVAHYGMQSVHKISSDGILLEMIDSTIPLTSNVFFSDKNTLVVTGGSGEPGPGTVVKIVL